MQRVGQKKKDLYRYMKNYSVFQSTLSDWKCTTLQKMVELTLLKRARTGCGENINWLPNLEMRRFAWVCQKID